MLGTNVLSANGARNDASGDGALTTIPGNTLAAALRAAMTPATDQELAEATTPYPHLFMAGRRGLFPRGEVTLLAAAGREGKTYTLIGLVTAYALGLTVGEMKPQGNGRVAIFSAEDGRRQYAAKIAASISNLGAQDREKVQARIIVPDLFSKELEPLQVLVMMLDRQPTASASVGAIVDAVTGIGGLDLLVFETASTLSEAEEDNPGFRALIKALKRIARETHLPVVLTHHTSQLAAQNLAALNISVYDIRGATPLVFNSRQNCMLINLGSEDDGFAESDARTILRRMVLPTVAERVTMLAPLDSSMGADAPVLFFKWTMTGCGPAPEVVVPRREYQGLTWRQLKARVDGAKAGARDARHAAKAEAEAAEIVAAVQDLHARGIATSAKAVTNTLGRSSGWVAKRLTAAVDAGYLEMSREQLPHVHNQVAVYLPTKLDRRPTTGPILAQTKSNQSPQTASEPAP